MHAQSHTACNTGSLSENIESELNLMGVMLDIFHFEGRLRQDLASEEIIHIDAGFSLCHSLHEQKKRKEKSGEIGRCQ